MRRGYTNDKILDDKILNLENMKNMSTDDIAKLYKDNYRIESMQYSTYCTGTVSPDRYNTNVTVEYNYILRDALAQRVMPTSRCLKSVTLYLATYPPNPANDMYVEIRRNDTSLDIPLGDPQSGNDLGHTVIPYSSITSSFTEITVSLDILLNNTDITNGIWIVTCLNAYTPTISDYNPYCRTKTGSTGTSTENMAIKDSTLQWQKAGGTWNMYFKTNKQTYTVPCPTPAISVTIQ